MHFVPKHEPKTAGVFDTLDKSCKNNFKLSVAT